MRVAHWRDLVLCTVAGVSGSLLAHKLLGLSLHLADGWQALWVLLAAPALEEWVFRVLLQAGVQAHIARVTAKPCWTKHGANALVAFCFAAAHVPAQGWLALWWVLPSLVLGELWRRHGRWWLCVLAHAGFNLSLWVAAALAL